MLGARLITAIKTPYLPSGKIDIAAYDAHVERQIAGGVQGLVVGGTTGEGQLMSWDEHIMLIAHTVNRFGDQLAILGNTGSNNTAEALKATGLTLSWTGQFPESFDAAFIACEHRRMWFHTW